MPAIVAMPQSLSSSALSGPSSSSSMRQPSHDDLQQGDRSRARQHYASGPHDEDYEGDDGEDEEDDAGTEDGMTGAQDIEASGQELISETTVKSGYLYKRGEKRKNWKKRWFVLRSSKLFYYKNEKEYQLLRFIDMDDVHTIAPVDLKKAEHSFGIVTSKRQYYVRASSAKEMQEWVDALRQIREALRQRSTLTRDMGALDVSGASTSGQEGASSSVDASAAKRRTIDTSIQGIAQQQSASGPSTPATAKPGPQASPISIVIPGKGLYKAPAQPQTSSSGAIISPLSATSDSESGAHSGAEHFGLSYASSTGHSFGSSPGRTQHFQHGSHGSPQHASGGDDDPVRRTRAARQQQSHGLREVSTGSSGAEQQLTEGKSGVLSSSDEDGEGDEWDEDEEADRAMPLPTHASGSVLSPTPMHGANIFFAPSSSSAAQQGEGSIAPPAIMKPKVESEFFKDPNKIILQGYLMKQSSRRKQWRKRWFTLTSGHLSYSRSHMDSRAHRRIPLASILDALEYTSKKAAPIAAAPLSPGLGSSVGSPSSSNAGASAMGMSASNSKKGVQSSDISGEHAGKGGLTSPGSPPNAPTPIAERRAGTTPSISLGGTPSFMSMPSAMGALTTPGGGAAKRKKENCFKIITPKRTFLICAPTEEEELKWLSALRALLAHWRESQEGTPSGQSQMIGQTQGQVAPAAAEQSMSETANRPKRSGSASGLAQQAAQQAPTSAATPSVTSPKMASNDTQAATLSRMQMPSVSVTRPQEASASKATEAAQPSVQGSAALSTPTTADTTASSSASTVTPVTPKGNAPDV